jgi:hypothetical protein
MPFIKTPKSWLFHIIRICTSKYIVNGYWWILSHMPLMVILSMVIDGYYIGAYFLFILNYIMTIGGYSITSYCWIL